MNSIHERKVEMARRAGGFIGLPGGFGTFEEVRYIYALEMRILVKAPQLSGL